MAAIYQNKTQLLVSVYLLTNISLASQPPMHKRITRQASAADREANELYANSSPSPPPPQVIHIRAG